MKNATTRADRLKHIIAILWMICMAVLGVLWWRSGVSASRLPDVITEWLDQFGFYRAALVYIVAYALRPLILFPATALTVAPGLMFGPLFGILFTIIGENASANVAFWLGRYFGRGWFKPDDEGQIAEWDRRLSGNAVVFVMILRLIYLPFDAVNYGCGLTRMRQRDYAIGTFIGILPGLISFVLLGGALSSGVSNRVFVLALAGAFFLLGLLIARRLKGRHEVDS